jgi:hypothetical protein
VLLEYDHRFPGFGQICRRNQTVVTAADDSDVNVMALHALSLEPEQ